ncbi:Pentatricopeptide repeat-containing protein [Platanthera zijinensis]|uniref:Pentatricopeptide repeat-containing protein n=1 Tax=Platanthera zijinensis TaxID=2320716 RepID=A0AAP0FZ31_9ASPA
MVTAGDHFTASYAISLLHDRSARHRLPEILSRILRHHLHLLSCSLLSDVAATAASLRRVSFTRGLLLLSPNPNLPLFNAAIKSLSFLPSNEPLRLFTLLRSAGLRPDRRTFAPLLKSCSLLPSIRQGSAVHAAALVAGFDAHAVVATQLVELYVQFGLMAAARKVFDKMPLRETVVWNIMINGFFRIKDFEAAILLFRQMSSRNIITWNTMLAGLSRSGHDLESVELFSELPDSGVEPDDATFATILPVCGRTGNSELGRRIHIDAKNRGLMHSSINVGNSLIDMYCKCADPSSAQKVFDEMPLQNVVTWNAMINGLAINGRGADGLHLFDEMLRRGAEPNSSTFVGVLVCCAHGGLEERGRELFRAMKTEHGIEPRPEHYGCMVDMLGRCGRTGEALGVIEGMPMRPTAAIWGALLSACRNNRDVEVGEVAARELVEAEPENSGNFVLLANLYAEAGRWEEAEKVWSVMRGMRVWKNKAQSSIMYKR